MKTYKIAGIKLSIDINNPLLEIRMKDYEFECSEVDVSIVLRESTFIAKPTCKVVHTRSFRSFGNDEDGSYYIFDTIESDTSMSSLIKMNADVSAIYAEVKDITYLGSSDNNVRSFNMVGEMFKFIVAVRNGLIFHASALSYKGKALLFSAPSGTGKSTHTGLWCEYYPEHSSIINDDCPAVIIEDDKIYAYGTPWSGKSKINHNVKCELSGIVFIERGEDNSIVQTKDYDALMRLMSQSFMTPYTSIFGKYINVADKIYNEVPMYMLQCNISRNAVDVVKNKIFKE